MIIGVYREGAQQLIQQGTLVARGYFNQGDRSRAGLTGERGTGLQHDQLTTQGALQLGQGHF